MLNLKFICEQKEIVIEMLKKRNQQSLIPEIEKLVENYNKKNQCQTQIDEFRNQRNIKSKEIGKIKSSGQDITAISEEVKKINTEVKTLEEEMEKITTDINSILFIIPNIISEQVPVGKDETANKVIRYWGEKPKLDFEAKPHWEIAENNNIIDFKRGTKLSGSRFVLYNNDGAKLERALINFMLDVHTREHNYLEFIPPLMVSSKTMTGTGQLPKFKEDLFKAENFDLYLIPTAEVPLTNIHSDEVLDEEQLPLYYTAYTPCFRSEAGSWGKDTRGLIRLHQFNKVELVKIVHPQNSFDELEKLTINAEKILQLLNLHYRVVALSSGDIGFSSVLTYDLEVWLPGMNSYREISSCSNCTDFQARRANIKYRDKATNKLEFVHTLNGSGLAVGRTLVAVLENYQTKDGKYLIPEVLKKYLSK